MSQQVPPGGWGPPPQGQQPQQQWGQQPGAPQQQDQGAPQPTVPAGPGYPPGYQAPSAQPAGPGFMHAPPPQMPDFSAFEAKKKEFDEKMDKLKKKRADLDKDLEPKRKKVRQEYRPKLVEARRATSTSGASAIGRAQWTLTLKLLIDLV